MLVYGTTTSDDRQVTSDGGQVASDVSQRRGAVLALSLLEEAAGPTAPAGTRSIDGPSRTPAADGERWRRRSADRLVPGTGTPWLVT